MKKGVLFLSVVLCLILSTTAAVAAPPSPSIVGTWDFYGSMYCMDESGSLDTVIIGGDLTIRTGMGSPGYLRFYGDSPYPELHPVTGVLVDIYDFTAVLGGDMILEGRMDRKGQVINFKITDINTGEGDVQCSGHGSLTRQ